MVNLNLLHQDITPVHKNKPTDELSFVLKPSQHEGIGVFATHNIRKGYLLHLFGHTSKFVKKANITDKTRLEFCRRYGVETETGFWIAPDFRCMDIGWYLNHSEKPNAYHDEKYNYFAKKDIKAGEEITIDYNELGED